MAKKIFKKSIKVTRLDRTDELTRHMKIHEETVHGVLVTIFASAFDSPVVMIDGDPAQRYTVTPQHIAEVATIVGFREKMKGVAHANARRN